MFVINDFLPFTADLMSYFSVVYFPSYYLLYFFRFYASPTVCVWKKQTALEREQLKTARYVPIGMHVQKDNSTSIVEFIYIYCPPEAE